MSSREPRSRAASVVWGIGLECYFLNSHTFTHSHFNAHALYEPPSLGSLWPTILFSCVYSAISTLKHARTHFYQSSLALNRCCCCCSTLSDENALIEHSCDGLILNPSYEDVRDAIP